MIEKRKIDFVVRYAHPAHSAHLAVLVILTRVRRVGQRLEHKFQVLNTLMAFTPEQASGVCIVSKLVFKRK